MFMSSEHNLLSALVDILHWSSYLSCAMWDKQLQTLYVLHYSDYSSVGKAKVCHITGLVL